MSTSVESVGRTVLAAATAATAAELGAELSRQVGLLVPHDGYMLVGVDPLTGAGCFRAKENGYSVASARRLMVDRTLGPDPYPFERLVTDTCPVGVLGTDSPEFRHSPHVHDLMAAEGFGNEMRIALTLAGTAWGGLVLMRERGSRPFSTVEAAHAEHLAAPLAATLRRFVASKSLRPARCARPPGVALVGADGTIGATTPSWRDWLRELSDHVQHDAHELLGIVWNLTHMARHAAGPALTRIPAPSGWIACHAQLLDDGEAGVVTVTIQPASKDVLLPAASAWYGITTREQAVIEHVLEGLPPKQIARRMDLSPHTVNDHLRAVYRKIGVTSREELTASLAG